ncbi:LVIVD repeat-containing protein [Ancylomarina sp.]|uniref:LVIVD repeat-containing protein n=1 Tax=Ancylomarina sp. TaxID=1970196 RepID=UPI00356A1B7D
MNNIIKLSFLMLIAVTFVSCEDKIEEKYHVNSPIYLSYEDLRASVKIEGSREFESPAKIYFKDNYIFVNEYLKGIHIIDNSDPKNPVNTSFLNIPGNVDIAIKGHSLYVDSYTDLVVLDIEDLSNIKEEQRFKNYLGYMIPPTGNTLRYDDIDETKGVIIGWEVKRVTVEIEEPDYIYPCYDGVNGYNSSKSPGINNSTTGTAGSMARFILSNDALYVLKNEHQLTVYDISNVNSMTHSGDFNVGWMMETLFISENRLFIGGQNGMNIYDLSSPYSPEFISNYNHFRGCDPVVVENNTAYVTIRSGNTCGQNQNVLDVIDLSDINLPKQIKSYQMTEPYGLGIDNSILFVCDGSAGLKIYDANDPLTITQHVLALYPDINTYDVIPFGDLLICIGRDGLYQYDYSDIENIELLSKIEL